MTFYEAAVEVLRTIGRPLHYKKITEIAIKRGLLSHIGKTPELTMGSRLNQETRKDNGSAVVIRTRPGVFALRVWNESIARTPDNVHELATPAVDGAVSTATPESGALHSPDERQRATRRRRRRRRAQRAQELLRELENGSDLDDAIDAQDAPEPEPSEDSAPEADAPEAAKQDRAQQPAAQPRGEGRRRGRRGSGRGRRSEAAPVVVTDDNARTQPPSGAAHGLGQIAAQAYEVLNDAPSRAAMHSRDLSDALVERGAIAPEQSDPSRTLHAALSLDNARRDLDHRRPRFERGGGRRWRLTEWSLSQAALDAEAALLEQTRRLHHEAEAGLSRALGRLSPEAVHGLVLTLLERMSFEDLKIARMMQHGDALITGTQHFGLSPVRAAIQLRTDLDRPITRDDVVALRATLHHHDARQGIVLALGQIDPSADEESRIANLPPVLLYDGRHIAQHLVKHGIGVRTYHVPVIQLDTALLADLTPPRKGRSDTKS